MGHALPPTRFNHVGQSIVDPRWCHLKVNVRCVLHKNSVPRGAHCSGSCTECEHLNMSDFLVLGTFSDSVKSPVTPAFQRIHGSTSVGSGDVARCTSIDHHLEECDGRILLRELPEGCVTTMVDIVGIRIHSNQCEGTVQPAYIDGY